MIIKDLSLVRIVTDVWSVSFFWWVESWTVKNEPNFQHCRFVLWGNKYRSKDISCTSTNNNIFFQNTLVSKNELTLFHWSFLSFYLFFQFTLSSKTCLWCYFLESLSAINCQLYVCVCTKLTAGSERPPLIKPISRRVGGVTACIGCTSGVTFSIGRSIRLLAIRLYLHSGEPFQRHIINWSM